MKIILAKDAGYCFGVRDAVNSAYEMSKKSLYLTTPGLKNIFFVKIFFSY